MSYIGERQGERSEFLSPEDAAIKANLFLIICICLRQPSTTAGCQQMLSQMLTGIPEVDLDDDVKIQNNVSVYDNVILEDDVFCGPSMVFTNVYNPRSAVSRKDEYRDTLVERGATLGANCTIVCGTRIGRYAFIGAGAVVNRSVKPFALMVGVPARQIGWMSAYGERVDLPLEGDGEWICPHSGARYKLNGDQLDCIQMESV